MKPKRPEKKGGRDETAKRDEPVRASAPGRRMSPGEAVECLRIRVGVINREWPNDAGMQSYRAALEMAVDALAEKYGITETKE